MHILKNIELYLTWDECVSVPVYVQHHGPFLA